MCIALYIPQLGVKTASKLDTLHTLARLCGHSRPFASAGLTAIFELTAISYFFGPWPRRQFMFEPATTKHESSPPARAAALA